MTEPAQGTCATCKHWELSSPRSIGVCTHEHFYDEKTRDVFYTSPTFGCIHHEPNCPEQKKAASDTEKVAFAQDVFGKGGERFLPLMNDEAVKRWVSIPPPSP